MVLPFFTPATQACENVGARVLSRAEKFRGPHSAWQYKHRSISIVHVAVGLNSSSALAYTKEEHAVLSIKEDQKLLRGFCAVVAVS